MRKINPCILGMMLLYPSIALAYFDGGFVAIIFQAIAGIAVFFATGWFALKDKLNNVRAKLGGAEDEEDHQSTNSTDSQDDTNNFETNSVELKNSQIDEHK